MTAPGPLALVGSGEYLPVMEPVERLLLTGRPPRFVQLATAAAPEGPEVLAYWHARGRGAAERLGVEQVVVPVEDRVSADDPNLAALVAGAGLVYLSGGDPAYLADILRGSAVWRAIDDAWRGGAALAGCSAGAMALGDVVPRVRGGRGLAPALGVVPHLRVVPHFDTYGARIAQREPAWLDDTPPGVHVVGVDEDTALLGGPEEWTVLGRGGATVLSDDGRSRHPAGAALRTPRPAADRSVGSSAG